MRPNENLNRQAELFLKKWILEKMFFIAFLDWNEHLQATREWAATTIQARASQPVPIPHHSLLILAMLARSRFAD